VSKEPSQPKKESGWDVLRQENEGKHKPDFNPIRGAIRRNEFLGSIVELFISAIVGVSKFNLGAKEADPSNKLESRD
jgi:hypothetical protein